MDFSYTAIVLGKREIGETDRLYTFFTKEAGKVRAVGRGTRKPAAKLAGHMETLFLVDLSVARSRGRGNISSAVAEEVFPSIRTSEQTLRVALEGAAILDRFTEEGEPDERLFSLLFEFLSTLNSVSADQNVSESKKMLARVDGIVRLGFLWKALDVLGFGVETKYCAVGGEGLRSGERYFFSADTGGVVCEEHRSSATHAIPIEQDAVKLLRILLSNRVSALPKLAVNRSAEQSLSMALDAFLKWIR